MIKYRFDCYEMKRCIDDYLAKHNMTKREFCEKLGIKRNYFYVVYSGKNIPWARHFQKFADELGIRFTVDGREFRYDDFHQTMVELARECGTNIYKVAEEAGCHYAAKSLSLLSIQFILEEMGLYVYAEDKL